MAAGVKMSEIDLSYRPGHSGTCPELPLTAPPLTALLFTVGTVEPSVIKAVLRVLRPLRPLPPPAHLPVQRAGAACGPGQPHGSDTEPLRASLKHSVRLPFCRVGERRSCRHPPPPGSPPLPTSSALQHLCVSFSSLLFVHHFLSRASLLFLSFSFTACSLSPCLLYCAVCVCPLSFSKHTII